MMTKTGFAVVFLWKFTSTLTLYKEDNCSVYCAKALLFYRKMNRILHQFVNVLQRLVLQKVLITSLTGSQKVPAKIFGS